MWPAGRVFKTYDVDSVVCEVRTEAEETLKS